jgi:hypothetical protein
MSLNRQAMHERNKGNGSHRRFQIKIYTDILPIVTVSTLG